MGELKERMNYILIPQWIADYMYKQNNTIPKNWIILSNETYNKMFEVKHEKKLS